MNQITTRVKEILETQQRTSKSSGKPYSLTTFKGEDEKLYKDVYGTFTVGQEVTGEWKDSEYGVKFEVVRPTGGGRGFQGRSPEEKASIEWQSARRDALEYIIAKANLFMEEAKLLEPAARMIAIKNALEELSGKHWLEVTKFSKEFGSEAARVARSDESTTATSPDSSNKQQSVFPSDTEIAEALEEAPF